MKKEHIRLLIIVLGVVLIYGNTLTLKYALDDRLVIFENDYTLQGFKGVKEVMTEDGFSGFFGKTGNLVAGGRYRPFAQLTFILEYELFGKSIKDRAKNGENIKNEAVFAASPLPLISHLGNLLLYLFLSIMIYLLLKKVFRRYDDEKWYRSLPFITTLIFVLHPLHTEVVANIKGRDEILAMLGGVMTLWTLLLYVEKRKIYWLVLSFFTMLIGVFSKENALTFLAVIPIVLYFSDYEIRKPDWLLTLLPATLAVIIFMIFRYYALGSFMAEDTTGNILNNPFVNSTALERVATVIYTWGLYLKLLIFPHPLTHDYYPKQLEITGFNNPIVIILALFFIVITVYAIVNLKKKSLLSFGVLFFIITFSMVSNLLFNIGTFMNERFLFIPLLGFAIILAFYLIKLTKLPLPSFVIPAVMLAIFLLYSAKTISRNLTWRDDFTLFTTDVQVSSNSIKCNISAGGSYLQKYKHDKKEGNLRNATKYLYKALELDSLTYHAHQLLGELYFETKDYDQSYQFYRNASLIDPGATLPIQNMEIVLQAKNNNMIQEAEKLLNEGNPAGALRWVNIYLKENERSAEAYNLKGKIYGMGMQKLDTALIYLQKAIALKPDYFSAMENMGVAYAIKGDDEKALYYLLKAEELEPGNENTIINISNLYRSKGNLQKADEWLNKIPAK